MALEAHCRAISRIAHHLRGFGKGKWWKDSAEQATGIGLAVDELERTVYAPNGRMERSRLQRGWASLQRSGGCNLMTLP